MVAEEGLPWSAGCCGASRTIVSVRSRRHISRKGDFPAPAGLLASSGEYGEQVPVVGSPRFERTATPSLRVKLLTWVSTVPGQEEPLADLRGSVPPKRSRGRRGCRPALNRYCFQLLHSGSSRKLGRIGPRSQLLRIRRALPRTAVVARGTHRRGSRCPHLPSSPAQARWRPKQRTRRGIAGRARPAPVTLIA